MITHTRRQSHGLGQTIPVWVVITDPPVYTRDRGGGRRGGYGFRSDISVYIRCWQLGLVFISSDWQPPLCPGHDCLVLLPVWHHHQPSVVMCPVFSTGGWRSWGLQAMNLFRGSPNLLAYVPTYLEPIAYRPMFPVPWSWSNRDTKWRCIFRPRHNKESLCSRAHGQKWQVHERIYFQKEYLKNTVFYTVRYCIK